MDSYEKAIQNDPVDAFFDWEEGVSYQKAGYIANAALPELEAWRLAH